jgi:hypothetical protein
MRIARQLSIGLALFVGLALLSTPARATVQVFNGSNVLQPGSTATLDNLVNHGWYIEINNGVDTKKFSGFSSFTTTNVPIGSINVTGNDAAGPNPLNPGPGITISGPFNATAGTTQDTSFNYTTSIVSGNPGARITDISLAAAGAVPTGGMITVTETVLSTVPPISGTPSVFTLQVPPPGTSKLMDISIFPGVTSVTVHKDIQLVGGSGTGPGATTSLTDLTQRFSQSVVPEPSTLALAGLGALGFIGYGLRRRKASGA